MSCSLSDRNCNLGQKLLCLVPLLLTDLEIKNHKSFPVGYYSLLNGIKPSQYPKYSNVAFFEPNETNIESFENQSVKVIDLANNLSNSDKDIVKIKIKELLKFSLDARDLDLPDEAKTALSDLRKIILNEER